MSELLITIIKTFKERDIPTIFIFTGIVLIFLAVVGQISGRIGNIELTKQRQVISAVVGGIFIILGLVIVSIPVFVSSPSTSAITPTETTTVTSLPIFTEKLASGYDIGVNTSGGLTNWMSVKEGEICMTYPSGQSWGVVFITAGKSNDPSRSGKDFSEYKKLSIELRGQTGGESVSIGIKDANDSEEKIIELNLTSNWKVYDYPLSGFESVDMHNLYVVAEFVFEDTPESLCVRNIRYLP